MSALSAELSAVAGAAFAAEGLSPTFGQVTRSDRPDLAQFQCNGALAAAKQAKANPRAIAEKVAARLKADPLFAKVEIAGPGFINLDVTDAALTARGVALSRDARLGAPETGTGQTLVIDFGGPNIAKPMHVGHLRSAIIGDCLQRLYRANGWSVTSDVHLGDWGLQMGQLISEIEHRGIAPVYFDAAFTGPYPGSFAGDDGRSGGHLSGRGRGLQSRRGAARMKRARRRPNCKRVERVIARCGSISSTSPSSALTGNMTVSACISTCGRARPASIRSSAR